MRRLLSCSFVLLALAICFLDAAESRDQDDRTAQLTYASWTKFCLKGKDTRQVCFTGNDGRIKSGQSVIAAVIIEPEGEAKKILRVTLPLGVQMAHGTRVIVDNNPPIQAPFVICFVNGCMADYEVTPKLLANMKKGQNLRVQAINSDGAPLNLPLPLAEFANAYDGPPTDPKAYEEPRKKLANQPQGVADVPSASLQGTPVAPRPLPQSSVPYEAGRRIALLIGNSRYRNVGQLDNPSRDVDALAEALRLAGFQNVTVRKDLTLEQMISSIRDFSNQADSADWAVVYFAGHGMELSGTNYMIPVDAHLTTDREVLIESVDLDKILKSVEGARKLKLVIVDACRSNPFASVMRLSMPSRSIGRGLAPVEPESGSLVVYAAKGGQEALDGEGGSNSPFMAALVRRIQTPNLEIRRLFDYVRDDVLDATNRRQQPFTYGSLPGREDFYFVAK